MLQPQGICLRQMLKETTLLTDCGTSVPSLITGSSCTSPALSGGETSNVVFNTLLYQEEEHSEENLE